MILANIIFPLPKIKTYSQTVMAADSTLLCAYLTEDENWRMHTSLDEVNPEMVEAIIAKEDRWFYWHPGVNPFAIGRALSSNIISGKRVSGASTITMQLARMSDRSPRTYLNKFKEMFRAFQFEWKYSKREILEMYLSYLPYGGNVEGVAAASYIYLNRPPEKISLSQSILLTVIPNRPNSLRLDKHGDEAKKARDKWIEKFKEENVFEEDLLDIALNEPIAGNRYSIENKTPHICYELKKTYPEKTRIMSTIEPGTQKRAERLLANHVQRVKSRDVTNGAVLVVDNQTHKVVAYCGSADFYDQDALGQVNGVDAIRSPGSTLKSAAYALGFDLGLITPKMKLLDIPGNFRSFVPENYDLTFHGQVTVHYALAHSLNIPPVRLVHEMDNDRFINLLENAGFETIKSKRAELGLSTVLGGCGVTLEELVRFYSNFANEGVMPELAYLQEEVADTSGNIRLFSPGSAWMTAQILSDLERPDLPQQYVEDSKLPKVAWKTGTSYGKRDAWAIGFSPRYTIGVWMGNFDGRGAPELSGSYMAVPLLMDLFNAIDYDPEKTWFEKPWKVLERRVCSETGHLPTATCKHYIEDYFIEGTSPLKACDLDQEIFVSDDESIQFCPACLPDSGYKKDVYPMHDPELVLWLSENNLSIRTPPPHNPLCEEKFTGTGPKIISPSMDYDYLVERDSEQEILLQAASDPTVSKHYWYINDKFYATASPDEKIFFSPNSKKMDVVCMDDKGRKSKVEVKVEFY